MRTLYELDADWLKIMGILQDIDGETSKLGDAEEAFNQWFESTAADRAKKMDGYVEAISHIQMQLAAAQAEQDRINAMVKGFLGDIAFLKERMKRSMILSGEEKIVTEKGRVVSIRGNGGPVPIVWDDELFNNLTAGEIAVLETEGYVVMNPMIDKAMVRKALTEGKKFAFAEFGDRGTQLSIK